MEQREWRRGSQRELIEVSTSPCQERSVIARPPRKHESVDGSKRGERANEHQTRADRESVGRWKMIINFHQAGDTPERDGKCARSIIMVTLMIVTGNTNDRDKKDRRLLPIKSEISRQVDKRIDRQLSILRNNVQHCHL